MKFAHALSSFYLLIGTYVFAADSSPYTFPITRQPGQIDKVTCQLEIRGELSHLDGGKDHSEKVDLTHRLTYAEKMLATGSQGSPRSARYYEEVEAALRIGEEGSKLPLRKERKLIGAAVTDEAAVLFSPSGPLTQEELIAIDVLGNSLLLDHFLPEKPVAIGDSWKHSEKLVSQFLWLDNVGQCDVQSTLTEVTPDVARFKMSGKVLGIYKGSPSEIEIEAKYRYDRHRNRIDWLGMRIKEQRKGSQKTDGANVVARAQTLIVPSESIAELSDASLKNLSFDASPEQLTVTLQGKDEWEMTSDRCWELLSNKRELNLLDKGDIIAQCNVSTLPKATPESLVSLEDYQQELKTALGNNFGGFVKASESANAAQYRVLRVEISGNVSEVPIHWIYYHVADPQGRQAVFAFVVEDKYFDRLAEKDKKLVDSFRFKEAEK